MTINKQAWEALWDRGINAAKMAKRNGFTLEQALDTYGRKLRENLSANEDTNKICDDFMTLLKEEITEHWHEYSEPGTPSD